MRQVQIPLFLWISAALVLHLVGGGGVAGVTIMQEKVRTERDSIRDMVGEVRRELGVLEVEIDGLGPGEPLPEPPPEEEGLLSFAMRLLTAEPSEEAPSEDAAAEELDPYKALIASLLARAAASDPEPEPPKPPDEKPEEKPEPEKVAEVKPAEPEKDTPPPPVPQQAKPMDAVLLKDKRIAIDQVAKNKDQRDNPDAKRLAEHALTVDEESVARIRSQDHKTDTPTPGTNQRGPTDHIGNASAELRGSLEEKPGDPTRAPGESSPSNHDSAHAKPQPAAAAKAARSGGPGDPSRSPGAQGRSGERPSPAMPGLPGGGGAASPEVADSGAGSWNINPSRVAGSGSGSGKGKASAPILGVLPFGPRSFGFGMLGAPGGPPNVTWDGLEKAVGAEQLRKEREAVGASIRAQHKGRFDTGKFARFLPDIENYDPTVKIGNQTALNAAQSPFAKYLHDIHNRIHPIFAEEFLLGLESLPQGHPLRDQGMAAHVEIILSQTDGKVVRMGVVKNSGSTVFDAAALDAVDRAGPYGKAPEVIASSNGLVYLHWEFHRSLVDACSTRNAHPFIVKDPKPVVPNVPPRKPGKATKKPTDEAPSGPLLPLRQK